MSKTSKKSENLIKKYSKRFPTLVETVASEHPILGPIRIQRKTLKETKDLLANLSITPNIEFQFYDCSNDADLFGYERYCVFYIEYHVDNLPVVSQTVIHLLKELPNMNSKMLHRTSDVLINLLDSQMSDINLYLLSRIISRTEVTIESEFKDQDTSIVSQYLRTVNKSIIDSKFHWEEAVLKVNERFGYNRDIDTWTELADPLVTCSVKKAFN